MPVVCLLVNHSFSTFDIHAYNDSPGPHENITHNMKLSLSNKLKFQIFLICYFKNSPLIEFSKVTTHLFYSSKVTIHNVLYLPIYSKT